MESYIVTYVSGMDDSIVCKVMNGNQIANIYGFSDCTGDKLIGIYEVNVDGSLTKCEFNGSVEAPFNWLLIFNPERMSDSWYEWNEH